MLHKWGKHAGACALCGIQVILPTLFREGSFLCCSLSWEIAPSPLYSVILVGFPLIASSFTDHWDWHVTKTDHFHIFPCSIHRVWLTWREKEALPWNSWTRRSMNWSLTFNHCLYVAVENKIRDNWNWDRWVCKKRLCLCWLLVLVLDGPRAALVPLDVLLFLWARSVQWDNKSLLRSVSQFVFSFCYVCRDSWKNHKVVIRSKELLMLDPRIQNYLILGEVWLIRLLSSGPRKCNYIYVTSQQTAKCSPL